GEGEGAAGEGEGAAGEGEGAAGEGEGANGGEGEGAAGEGEGNGGEGEGEGAGCADGVVVASDHTCIGGLTSSSTTSSATLAVGTVSTSATRSFIVSGDSFFLFTPGSVTKSALGNNADLVGQAVVIADVDGDQQNEIV